MVVKPMRWPSWPPQSSRKFEVSLVLQRMESLEALALDGTDRLLVDIMWKGQKSVLLPSLQRFAKRNSSTEGALSADGSIVEWKEEFSSFCTVSSPHPWEILFRVSKKSAGQKGKVVVGVGSLNIMLYASAADGREIQIEIPVKINGETPLFFPSLFLSLSMAELKSAAKHAKTVPVRGSPPKPVSLSKNGLKRVKIFGVCVSGGTPAECFSKEKHMLSGEADSTRHDYQFDDDSEEEESEEYIEFFNSIRAFKYETLASANLFERSSFSNTSIDDEDEQWTYYGNVEHSFGYFSDQITPQSSKGKVFSWRKLSFRSPKGKGEPLLKNSEDGGDDIDHCRRQLSYSNFRLAVSMFGDDVFVVGKWEEKEITSRDSHLKLHTKIFFASIDQRSELAAGESACTALVVVIADWLHSNSARMPIKSEFDGLVRQGSSHWRNLCENKDYIDKFPDKHFDIDTIMQAKICPLSIEHDVSFVGFFTLDGLEDGGTDFFEGAMSFDGMWDEIARSAMDCHVNGNPLIYIVSWNDHFFVLKVEKEAYYIVDTLGERLFEGCNEAYILKFDENTSIERLSDQIEASNEEEEKEIAWKGKESCKEYIKSFLAAIPIREAEEEIRKGLLASTTTVHRRLQIEFHRTLPTRPNEENLFQLALENGNSTRESMVESKTTENTAPVKGS